MYGIVRTLQSDTKVMYIIRIIREILLISKTIAK